MNDSLPFKNIFIPSFSCKNNHGLTFNLCDRFGEGESSSSGELRIHSELRRPTSRDDLDPRGELQFVGDLNTFFDKNYSYCAFLFNKSLKVKVLLNMIFPDKIFNKFFFHLALKYEKKSTLDCNAVNNRSKMKMNQVY